MKATFENSVEILLKSYLNNTLFHGSCHACAVGNLIAANCGYNVARTEWKNGKGGYLHPTWDSVFCTALGTQEVNTRFYNGEAKRQIDSTGYHWTELALIEKAFESVQYDERNSDQHMFDGLMAVVDVLADIHGISLEQKSVAKSMFVKETTTP